MFDPILTIARYTFYEAVRNRLFLLTAIGLVCLLGLTAFIGDLAITESRQVQAAIVGSSMRIFTVITVALFVITSTVREFNDKGFELLLSLPMPRYTYYFGKFAGFFLLALVITFSTGILLLAYCDISAILMWTASLICELSIIISLSILCLFTFSNITVAFITVTAFYFLSRSIYAIQLISLNPILESRDFSQEFINYMINIIAYILPELHSFTRSEWLLYGPKWGDLVPVFGQTSVYLVLLVAAGLFDLYRKDS